MKRFVYIVSVLVILVLIAHYQARKTGEPPLGTPLFASPTPTPVSVPTTLKIPKLKINAVVESVGVTSTNNMDVPHNASHVGWYRFGPTPSLRGNAVITGHYDTPSGRPAIFYHLNRLVVGDTIDITLNNGSQYTFIVTKKDIIANEVFPDEYVFGDKYGINLNLITCSGVWDPIEKNYNKRLVVYSTLKGTQFGTFP